MVAGQMVGFGISVVMIITGILLCLYSIYDRKTAEDEARKIAGDVERRIAGKAGITASPIPIADLNDIIKAIIEIKNPFMQVGVFLTVFGIIIMIISIFIPF